MIKTYDDDISALKQKRTEKNKERDTQIKIIFDLVSKLNKTLKTEIPELKIKYTEQCKQFDLLVARVQSNATITTDIEKTELQECLDKIVEIYVTLSCKIFIETELSQPDKPFVISINHMLKHKKNESKQNIYKHYSDRLERLSNANNNLVLINLQTYCNEQFQKVYDDDQKFIQDRIIRSDTSVMEQSYKHLGEITTKYLIELSSIIEKINNLYDKIKQKNSKDVEAEMSEISHLRYSLDQMFRSQSEIIKKMKQMKLEIDKLTLARKILEDLKPKETPSSTDVSFGENNYLPHTIYEIYKQLYILYYTPCVLKSQVLILYGIGNNTELKVKYKPYLHWHYELIGNHDYNVIKDVYDTQYDSSLMSLYNNTISLTSLTPSTPILQHIGAISTVENMDALEQKMYIHVGLFGFSILKKYLNAIINNNEYIIDNNILDLLQKLIKIKTEIITQETNSENTVQQVNLMFDEYIQAQKHTCDIILYEQCITETCDPFYRFGICPTTYKYESLQIDYYNTCLNSSVSELNKNYQNIAEHYIIDNTISKIYLKKNNSSKDLKKDVYFRTKIMQKLINPNEDVTCELLYTTLYTQGYNKTNNTNKFQQVIRTILEIVQEDIHYSSMNIHNMDNNEVITQTEQYKNATSLVITINWLKSTHTSTIYIREILAETLAKQNIINHNDQNTLKDSNQMYNDIKQWVLQHYIQLNEIMTPCLFSHWSLNTSCTLTPCNYTFRCLWFILDTSNYNNPHFLCPMPYIDTTFLKLLHCINTLQKLMPYKLYELSYMAQKLNFLKYNVCQEQILGKIARLIEENSTHDIITKVYNEITILFQRNRVNEIIPLIETNINTKSFLGKLFHILGTKNSTLHVTNSKNSDILENFHMHILQNFLHN